MNGASQIVGHAEVRRILEHDLPPVTLLRGPESIGKWTLAMHLAQHHVINPLDLFVVGQQLTAAIARELVSWSRLAPCGLYKLALINLRGATHQAVGILLKTLEEPPPGVRFLLTASFALPDTLVSRCRVYTMSALTADELYEVLRTQEGLSKPVATRLARTGRGQVGPAVRAHTSDAAHAAVTGIVQALARKDAAMFEAAIGHVDAVTRDLLHRWMVEALTGERILFTDDDMHGLDRDKPRLTQMLRRLSAAPNASARLQLRVALEPFLAT